MSNEYLPPIIRGDILIVLSNPGMGDYVEGKLMSGKDGQILKNLLKDAGIDSGNCSVALWDHMPEIGFSYNPHTVIAMGNDALRALTKKSGIKKYRGQELVPHESLMLAAFVYPTYSVDDLKNVPTFRRTIVADLRNTQQGNAEKIDFEYWEDDTN